MKTKIDNESLGQGMGDRLENPRATYEAPRITGRPSILERGSSTTKRSQAVPTRAYQSDLPSLIVVRALPQGLVVSRKTQKTHPCILGVW